MATILGDSSDNLLTGTEFADLIQGLDGDDTLDGNAGNDTLQGGAGSDWLRGGAGHDTLYGGDGLDTALYDAETANMNISGSSVQFAGDPSNDDVLDKSVEGIWTGSGNDTISPTDDFDHEIRAGAGNDVVHAFVGDDTLLGQAGNDSLDGFYGNDVLWGGPGNDTLDGGWGIDRAIYTDETTALRVDMASETVAFPGSGAKSEHIASIEIVLTGSGNDTLLGGPAPDDLRGGGGTDQLRGGSGDDTLDGGTGRDTLDGGAGSDTARYASHGRDMTIDLVRQVAWAPHATEFTDVLRSIENAVGGQGNDSLIGSALAQSLDGGRGNDTLLGAAGDDTLAGGAGRDVMHGGDGNDTFIGATIRYNYAVYVDPQPSIERFFSSLVDGRDVIQGGAGTDTIVVPNAEYDGPYQPADFLVDANVNLIAHTLRIDLPHATTDRLFSIENVTTSGGDDTVQGDGEGNLISVGEGSNVVHGAGGDDTLVGGAVETEGPLAFQDKLYGEAGNDLIFGNGSIYDQFHFETEARDLLSGGSGDDTLVGGVWRAVMWGGPGADQFQSSTSQMGLIHSDDYFRLVGQHTQIRDFDPTEGDVIAVEVTRAGHPTPTFVGEVTDLESLGDLELGYVRQGNDTLLQLGPDSDSTEDALHIQLVGYSGPLTADDIVFI